MSDIRTLAELPTGERACVSSLTSTGISRQRMLDLGIVPDTIIEAVLESPSGGVTAYLIRGALIAIRREDAQQIIIY